VGFSFLKSGGLGLHVVIEREGERITGSGNYSSLLNGIRGVYAIPRGFLRRIRIPEFLFPFSFSKFLAGYKKIYAVGCKLPSLSFSHRFMRSKTSQCIHLPSVNTTHFQSFARCCAFAIILYCIHHILLRKSSGEGNTALRLLLVMLCHVMSWDCALFLLGSLRILIRIN
jgi:hypothetical protein